MLKYIEYLIPIFIAAGALAFLLWLLSQGKVMLGG